MSSFLVPGATGTIQFFVDGAAYGAPVSLSGGAADLQITGLPVGPHVITATYSGDTTYTGSTSPGAGVAVASGSEALTYFGIGKWGAGKGSNLTSAELDTNFFHLNTLLSALSLEVGAGVSTVTVSGGDMVITLTDGRAFNVPMPGLQMTFQGAYQPAAVYASGDLFSYSGDLYLVMQGHIAASPFNPFAARNSLPIVTRVGGQPILRDVAFFVPGTPSKSLQFVAPRALTLLGVIIYMREAPSSSQTYTISQNGAALGTVALTGNSNRAAISGSFAAGDVLTIAPPASPEGSDLSVTALLRRVA